MFINEMIHSDQWWHNVSTDKSSWNFTVTNVREWSQVMDHLLSGSQQLSPALILWINVPFESPSEVKSLSGHEGCEEEESFHQSTICHQAPWAVKLFIVSCLVLMNWFDSCSFRNIYQIKENKKAWKN